MLLAEPGIQLPDAFQQMLRIGGRRQQMQRFLHPFPLAFRNHHHAFPLRPHDLDRRLVGDDAVEHGFEIGAGFGNADGLHEYHVLNSVPDRKLIAGASLPCYNLRMNMPLKITKIGNSAGVILPKELLAHLNAAAGDSLSVVVTPRGIELSAAEPDFDAQMAAARDVMARRKRALRELAK